MLASVLFGSLVGFYTKFYARHPYWVCVLACISAIIVYAFVRALWVVIRLPSLDFKDRRIDPVQRRKIADHLGRFRKRHVWTVTTQAAKREDGSAFSSDIERAIAGAWDVHDRDDQRASEAEKFPIGVSVYGAKDDAESKTILRDAFKKAKIDLYVDTSTGVNTSMGYEDRVMVVVGLRETSLPAS